MTIDHPKVFSAEIEAGLANKIKAESSIAFVTEARISEGVKPKDLPFEFISEIVSAGLSDPDVYKTLSILVSTVWNKNDDIFNKQETWAARNTPQFKPTNIDHDEKQIVGGITNTWAVDSDFNLISDDTEASDLPDVYHLLVSSVIYKQWGDPELAARAEELIQQIEAGTKFVSMECIFRGFDYGIVSPEGQNHIVARSEDTAFLTQHLRSYGGTGEYQGHRLGRILRNITFSGKGYVDRPANPDSIIFNQNHIFSFANASEDKSLFLDKNGVNTNTEDNSFESNSIKETTMSDLLNDQIKELKDALASLRDENKALNDKLSAANVSQYEEKIKTLEASITELTEAKIDLETKLTTAGTDAEALQNELEAKSGKLEELEASFDKMKEDEKKKKRHASLVEAGLSTEDAEVKLDTFASLSDEQFDVIIKTVSEMKPSETSEASEESEETTSDDEEGSDETEASEVIEEGSEEEGSSMASEEEGQDELSRARTDLQRWVEQEVMNQKSE